MQRESIRKYLFKTLFRDIFIYPDSLKFSGDLTFFILKDPDSKYLGIMGPQKQVRGSGFTDQSGSEITTDSINGSTIRFFKRNDNNLRKLINIFPQLRPSPLGTDTSFGFGDRLGLANAAHIRAVKEQKRMLPVLAQQSVRELKKTKKDFNTVVKQSIWNIFQEGYSGKWGADADHIKEKEHFTYEKMTS